jgi:Spy/CpxP family protein refolding chaperone
MKTKLTLMFVTGSLLLGAFASPAQITGTNSLPQNQTAKYQAALENDRLEGERAILPPGLKEKMRLTDEQRNELKPIENDFADTSEQYQIANQPRIEAAQEAGRVARESKDAVRIEAARKQLQQVWAGLQPYRAAAVIRIKPLLTPEQVTILEDANNQWRESHGFEANDPSAH